MKTVKIVIGGMHCAACSAGVERSLKKVAGVVAVQVNLASNSAQVRYDESVANMDMLHKAIERMSFTVLEGETFKQLQTMQADDYHQLLRNLKVNVCFLLVLLYVAMVPMLHLPILPIVVDYHTHPIMFALVQLMLTLPILVMGRKFFIDGWTTLRHGMPTMDTLVAMGSGAAFVFSLYSTWEIVLGDNDYVHQLYYESAGTIIVFIMIGKMLEMRAKSQTGNALEDLMALVPPRGHILQDGQEYEVAVDEIMVADTVIVRTGDSVPVDGVITQGQVTINEAMLTGESLPVSKGVGESIYGGTIIADGFGHFSATQVGSDTALAHIMEMVENAQGTKPTIAEFADKVASIFVPTVLGIALLAGGFWLSTTGDMALAVKIMVAVLVIACPCALGLATPMAIMVAVGRGAKKGILFKNGQALQSGAMIDTVLFDKTGTITQGKMSVTDSWTQEGVTQAELLQVLASMETTSTHPLAQAIVAAAQEAQVELLSVTDVEVEPGKGMRAVVEGKLYFLGNHNIIPNQQELNMEDSTTIHKWSQEGKTIVYLATSTQILGAVGIADVLQENVGIVIEKLVHSGISVVMVTGDQLSTAKYIAAQVGIQDVHAQLLPQDKIEIIQEYQQRGKKVAMVGDGINDAPALVQADVGIAVGQGTGVAINSADIVLTGQGLGQLVATIELCRATLLNIKENLAWAFGYNIICIPIAAGAWYYYGGMLLNPMLAALVMSFSSVSVVLNALRLQVVK